VRRRLRYVGVPYWHHGIYINDSRVIEFGGGTLWEKGATQVRPVSLVAFANPDPVESVEQVSHPIIWSGISYLPPLSPEQVIDRAEWLVHNQPPPYRLGYRNCESIAVWCATGAYESFQVKGFMQVLVPVSMFEMLVIKWKPKLRWVLCALFSVPFMLTSVPYMYNPAFFNHTRRYPGVGNWTP